MRFELVRLAYVFGIGGLLTASLGARLLLAGDTTKMFRAFMAPIMEGQTLAGVSVGASELDVVTGLGVPDQVTSSPPGTGVSLKVADYGMPPSMLLRVFFMDGRVDAILVMTFDLSQPTAFTGKIRGVGLLSDLRAVRAAYGPGTGGRLWYPDLGIAFNPADRDRPDEEQVYAILVVRPGPNDRIETYGRVLR